MLEIFSTSWQIELIPQLKTSEKANGTEGHGLEVESAIALTCQMARVDMGKMGVGDEKHAKSRYHVILKHHPWTCRLHFNIDACLLLVTTTLRHTSSSPHSQLTKSSESRDRDPTASKFSTDQVCDLMEGAVVILRHYKPRPQV